MMYVWCPTRQNARSKIKLKTINLKALLSEENLIFFGFYLFFPVSHVQIERFSFLQALFLKKYEAAVRLNFPLKG